MSTGGFADSDRHFNSHLTVEFPGANKELIGACEPSFLFFAASCMRDSGILLDALSWDVAASAALVGLMMEVYIEKLLRLSVTVLRELARVSGLRETSTQCLTRSHIFRALLQVAFKGGLPEAIFTAFAEIGTPSTHI